MRVPRTNRPGYVDSLAGFRPYASENPKLETLNRAEGLGVWGLGV